MGEKETAAMSTAAVAAGAATRESPSLPSSGREIPTLASSGAREAGSGMATGRVAAADVDGDGVADFRDPAAGADADGERAVEYRDDDSDGDRLAAHEAAHTVQQREAASGRVAATDPDGGPAEAIGFGLRISGD